MTEPLIWTRIDPDGPGLHSPQLPGDIGWDLEAAEDVLLSAGTQMDVTTNVRIKLPEDCWGEIRARSSIARKGLQVDSGIIDTGYTGPLFVLMRNMNRMQRDNSTHCDFLGRVWVHSGERIGQLILHQAYRTVGQEVKHLEHDPRRGEAAFGSTGGIMLERPTRDRRA